MAQKTGTTQRQQRRPRILYFVVIASLSCSGCNLANGSPTDQPGQLLLGGSSTLLKGASVTPDPPSPNHASALIGPAKGHEREIFISWPADAQVLEIKVVDSNGMPTAAVPLQGNDALTLSELAAGRYTIEISWDTGQTTQGDVSLSGASLSVSEPFDHEAGNILLLKTR